MLRIVMLCPWWVTGLGGLWKQQSLHSWAKLCSCVSNPSNAKLRKTERERLSPTWAGQNPGHGGVLVPKTLPAASQYLCRQLSSWDEARPCSCAVLCHAQIWRAQLLSPRYIRQLQNGIGRSCLSAWPGDVWWHSRKGKLANSCWSNLLLTSSCLPLPLLAALEMCLRVAVDFSQCSWEGQKWQVQKSPFAAWNYPGRARGVRRSWTVFVFGFFQEMFYFSLQFETGSVRWSGA